MLIEVNNNFEAEVLSHEGLVLVDFWAPWCGPCKMMTKVMQEVADELPDVKVCKVDIDTHAELTTEYNVSAVPTFILFKNGEEVQRLTGANPKQVFIDLIKNQE